MNKIKIKACICGSDDLIEWLEDQLLDPVEQLDEVNKIECCKCGRIVWGGDDTSITDWNSQRYDEQP